MSQRMYGRVYTRSSILPLSPSPIPPLSIQPRQLIRVAAMAALDFLYTSSQAAQKVKRRRLVFILDDHFQLDDLFRREGDSDFLRFGHIQVHCTLP